MSKYRPIATLAALLIFGALCAPSASGEPKPGRPTDPVSHQLSDSAKEFWTEERIAEAVPADMVGGPAGPPPEGTQDGPGVVYAEPVGPAHPVGPQPQAEEAPPVG